MPPLSYNRLSGIIASLGVTYPSISNRDYIIFGDSRTANSTEDSNSALTPRLTAQGYGSWVQLASNFRGKLVGNYGINTDTIDGLITRLHAAGLSGGTAPTDPRRGFVLDYDPGLNAGTYIVLVGVNNTTEVITTTGPKYDTLFKAIIDAGKVLVICNELPNSDQSGQGAANLTRRQYLEQWPNSSIGMTSLEKATYGAKVVRVNTYDAIAQSPTSYLPKTNYYTDLLHPNCVGSRVLGETIGTSLSALFAANGYQPRNTLPTNVSELLLNNGMLLGSTAITATNGETAGAGGANMDGNGAACVTGVVPTGWTIARGSTLRTLLNGTQPVSGSQLSIVSSKTVDSDGYDAWQITVTGFVGTTSSVYSMNLSGDKFFSAATIGATNGSNGIVDGDTIYGIARVKLNDGHTGLVGTGFQVSANSTTFPDTGKTILSGGINLASNKWDNMSTGFDKAILSQPRLIPTGFCGDASAKGIGVSLVMTIAGGSAINFTITVSRMGVIKNR